MRWTRSRRRGRRDGADVRAFPLDVTDRAAVERTVAAIEQAFGGIDVAILNAGGHLPGSGARFDGQQFVDNMTVNYFGVVYGIDAVLPGMLRGGGATSPGSPARRVSRGSRCRRRTAHRRRRSSTCWIRSASSWSHAGSR